MDTGQPARAVFVDKGQGRFEPPRKSSSATPWLWICGRFARAIADPRASRRLGQLPDRCGRKEEGKQT